MKRGSIIAERVGPSCKYPPRPIAVLTQVWLCHDVTYIPSVSVVIIRQTINKPLIDKVDIFKIWICGCLWSEFSFADRRTSSNSENLLLNNRHTDNLIPLPNIVDHIEAVEYPAKASMVAVQMSGTIPAVTNKEL